MHRAIFGGLLLAAAIVAPSNGRPVPGVASFSPQGSVEQVEQVKVRFATPMVAFGDPRAVSPFRVDCAGAGQGRWVNAQTLVWDFDKPLPGGQRCRFALRPGVRDAAGAQPQGPRLFHFDTGGPTLRASQPTYQIEEGQIFLLALNARPTRASVAAHASCAIEGVGEAVPLDILSDTVRDRILTGGAKSWDIGLFAEIARQSQTEIVAAKCRRTLPPGRTVSLLWGAGIRTPNGLTVGADERLEFKVRPAFTARLECDRANPRAGCLGVTPIRLSFTGQVPVDQARAIRLIEAGGKARAPKIDPKARTVDEVSFEAPLPEASRFKLVLPRNFVDDAGRPLTNADRFPLRVTTDENPPLVKFAGTFGIIEASEGGVLPVTLRNVERSVAGRLDKLAVVGGALRVGASDADVAAWLRRLEEAETRTFEELPIAGTDETRRIETTRRTPLILAKASGVRRIAVRKPNHRRALEVVGIPLGKPGFYVVELASPKLGAALLGPRRTRYVATGALVTNMSVHFQWGRGRSLAWVTRLDDARPVKDAAIAITDACSGRTLWTGRTDAKGRAIVPDALPSPEGYADCDYGQPPLMISARAGDDFSFTLTNWSEGIGPGDFNLPTGWGQDRDAYHTIFDRSLIRAGERISMKHVVRTRTDAGFAYPKLPKKLTLTISHWESSQEYKLPVVIGRDGIGETVWQSPKAAALGEYQVAIAPEGSSDKKVTGHFSIDEFKLPTMRAIVSGPKAKLVRPAAVPVDLYLGYMSGGGVARAPVQLRTLVGGPRDVMDPNYPGFKFGGEPVAPGVEVVDEGEGSVQREAVRAQVLPLTLDANGTARATVDKIGAVDRASQLVVEMDYEDANGEMLTAREWLPIEPAALRVGIATDGWFAKADDLRLKLLVIDLDGKPLARRRVRVDLYSREVYSYRKRLIGGFYAYDNTRETKRLKPSCEGTSDAQGLVTCRLDAGVSGEVIARASARDAQGRESWATKSVWLAGDDDWWFGGDNGDRMDVVPEQPEVAAGGIARFQVRMPFRNATALVSVLRDGVVDSFVTELSGKDPVIKVKMKRGAAPNVYVSVLAVRGRVSGWRLWLAEFARKWNLPWLSREGAAPTALVDLAKPAYRFGMASVRVGWDEHRLAVKVRTDATRYAIRQRAVAEIEVTAPRGARLPAGAEVAVAAIDEALLSLKENESWKLLDVMMAERPVYVFTSTAQTQVVGKRHYGLKAVPTGGGGGADLGTLARRDFDPLLLWRGRVRLDANGKARLHVPLNDSLSSFRIVAVATAGPDLFGAGSARIRTTQDLMLISGVPDLVRSGDRYVATMTLRNTTAKPLSVTVAGRAGRAVLPSRRIDIPAAGARAVGWNVAAPAGTGNVIWDVTARAGRLGDHVRFTQRVVPTIPIGTLQATLVKLDRPLLMPTALPAGAVRGAGGVEVALSPKLAGSLAGVRAFMGDYPFNCFEQELSKAIVFGDRARFERLMEELPRYLASDGLVRFFPADWIEGDDALTAYVLAAAHEAGWTIPQELRERMLQGLRDFAEGRAGGILMFEKERGLSGSADLGDDMTIRRVSAIATLARYRRATAAMLEPISLTPNRWPTAVVLDWITILRNVPDVPDASARLAAAEHILRARLDLQGTTLNVARSDGLWWLLGSGDTTAAKLLLTIADLPSWRGEAGPVARGLILRQRRGHWDTTVANAWGTLALARFARRFEATPVAGTTTVRLGGMQREVRWSSGTPAPIGFTWSANEASLRIGHQGVGAPWAIVTTRAAVPLHRGLSAGFSLRRSVTPVVQAVNGRWSRGDVARVRLEFDARSEMSWVALADPVPAGSTILGGSLGGRSQLLDAERTTDGSDLAPSYVERRQEALHAFWSWVPKGRTAYEYTVRFNTPGTFGLPPSRVEAMYAPEMFAVLPNTPVVVTSRH